MTLKSSLAAAVGEAFCSDDTEILRGYSKDYSLVKPMMPEVVVYPKNVDEIQSVVRYAIEHRIAITPRSSAVGFYGSGVPSQGGIVMDLKRMNRIIEVDERNKNIKVEPGVTWLEAQTELEKIGMMVCSTLLPHPAKSVLTSALEREPLLIPKSEYAEPLLTAELVLGNGDRFWTGTALAKGMIGQCFPDAIIPGTRLFLGGQGTLGIVTWAKIKIEPIPSLDRLYFLPFKKIEDLIEPLYTIQRKMLGSECFVMNSVELAMILKGLLKLDLEFLRHTLPPWTIVLCLSGTRRFPEEKIKYEMAALATIAANFNFDILPTLSDIPDLGAKLIRMLRRPYLDEPYWKFQMKGARQEIFFNTTLEKAPDFTAEVESVATEHGYNPENIGIYLQPVERARICQCNYGFSYNQADIAETEQIKRLFLAASRRVIDSGGLFTTPYGPWADMVYSISTGYTRMLRVVKDAFDPYRILNPGKLCFESTEERL